MAFASFDSKNANAPVADINMVPLIDVMLVLLVIFIITAPLLTNAVKLELPKASSQVNELKPDKIEFAIDAAGRFRVEITRVITPTRMEIHKSLLRRTRARRARGWRRTGPPRVARALDRDKRTWASTTWGCPATGPAS